MKLQTNIKIEKQKHYQIDYDSKLMLLGSCFAENMGAKFNYHKFQSTTNPFGILFHPVAIENLVTRAINQEEYTEDDLIFNNEQWSALDAHSKLNALTKETILERLNAQLKLTLQKIKSSTHIVITLGTSWVYRNISQDKIVANCHKLPQKQFLKELLTVDEIKAAIEAIITLIRSINPEVNFIFTVSPVRHLKDGFVENNRSKSHLLTAIHQVVDPRQRHFYFPSYEIMMDELRDYRFYNSDMIHPNELAVNYIWDCFKSTWLTDEALEISKKVAAIQIKKAHRPFNSKSEAHQDFLKQLNTEIDKLENQYPQIKF